MRKEYPYLEDSYYEDANSQKQKRKFLSEIDNFVNQKQYVKITLLNWHETPIKEIAGELSTGTITKDGSSAVRRTCQLTAVVSGGEYNIEDSEMDFAINKKVFIEIGVKNYSQEYPEYPILWFPQGVFFISTANVTSSASSTVNISLTLKDKMCGLNGEVGGTFQATTILDEQDTQSPSGQYVTEKVLVYNIIQELVHHFGGEDLNNIVIEDVPLRIKKVMKWSGDNPIYLVPVSTEDYVWYNVVEEKPSDSTPGVIQVQNGRDAGYIYDDFVYTEDLTANLGENVCTVLDKLKSFLGNYEYFYDVFGIFHFREIKNYLNTTQSKILVEDMNAHDYLTDVTTGKSVYTFEDRQNLISITSSPQYSNIKNDFIIQGLRKMTNSDISYNVRYHLAIDKKPKPGNTYYNLLIYKEKDTNLTKAIFPLSVDSESDLPIPGNFNLIYRAKDNNKFFYWEDDVYKEVTLITYYPPLSERSAVAVQAQENGINWAGYTTKDWRTEMFLQGLLAKNNGTDSGMYYEKLQNDYKFYLNDSSWLKDIYDQATRERIDTDFYFEELEAFWPQIYDLDKQEFIGLQEDETLYTDSLTDGNYFIDFIEPSTSGLGQFSVSNIGRRTDAVSNDDVNCLFQPMIPDIVFLNVDGDDFQEQLDECRTKGQPFTQVKGDIYWAFSVGGYKNGAFDQVKYELYAHTTYQKSLSLSALPVFYLEPNSRITINDASTNTYGDFLLKSISIPLGPGNAMNCTANECTERF